MVSTQMASVKYYRVACRLHLPIPETRNNLGAKQFFAPVYRESKRAVAV